MTVTLEEYVEARMFVAYGPFEGTMNSQEVLLRTMKYIHVIYDYETQNGCGYLGHEEVAKIAREMGWRRPGTDILFDEWKTLLLTLSEAREHQRLRKIESLFGVKNKVPAMSGDHLHDQIKRLIFCRDDVIVELWAVHNLVSVEEMAKTRDAINRRLEVLRERVELFIDNAHILWSSNDDVRQRNEKYYRECLETLNNQED